MTTPASSERGDSRLLELRLKELEERRAGIQRGTLRAMAMLLELKDAGRGLHTSRLSGWAREVGADLGLKGDELRDLEIAYLLHDIGKIGVSDALLLRPGRLTEEEIRAVRKHPEYGWAILHPVPGLEGISLLVLHQNEWFDGQGNPGGLQGEEIPLGSRIIAAVDTFEAIVSDRPYRRGMPPDDALGRLRAASGSRLDPAVVAALIAVAAVHLGELPRLLGIKKPQ